MTMELITMLRFRARRFLPRLSKEHVCAKMHWHDFRLEVRIDAKINPELGWIADYADIDRICRDTIQPLQESCLNDTLDNPTSENIGIWIARRLHQSLGSVIPSPFTLRVVLWETDNHAVSYAVSGAR